MFYEGTEKRLLICSKQIDLLQFPETFWQKVVKQSEATILSKIENNHVRAYLLSESSLFIWRNKLLLVTCGNTKLIKAALFLQQAIGKAEIETLLFQRHQALQPELQSSTFQQDTLHLTEQFSGQQHHWRDGYQGDLFTFGQISANNITTNSIYMFHGLNGSLSKQLQDGSVNKENILKQLKLLDFLPPLSIDHYAFTPKGYSLNALSGEDYLAIHLTPEKLSTYLSIESSFSDTLCNELIKHLQLLFNPQEFKVMHFSCQEQQLNIKVC